MIDRRDFANALALGLLGTPLLAQAQAAPRLAVVGVLLNGATRIRGGNLDAVAQRLGELGYVEGKNSVFEIRFGGGKPAAFPGFAAELVALKVDVIVAVGPAAAKAARDATRVIPIVAFDLETDPVQAGWARSLARPEGNLTGLFLDVPELAGKWIQLLRETVPGVRRMGLLWDPGTGSALLVAAKAAAQGFGIELHVMEARSLDDVAPALKGGMSAGIKAMVVLASPELTRSPAYKLITEFAAHNRLPAIGPFRSYSEAGGLMSYGVSPTDIWPRAAGFVARILKGAKPGDLAIELPTKFELVLNLKAAKALGISFPQALRLRADEVIE